MIGRALEPGRERETWSSCGVTSRVVVGALRAPAQRCSGLCSVQEAECRPSYTISRVHASGLFLARPAQMRAFLGT